MDDMLTGCCAFGSVIVLESTMATMGMVRCRADLPRTPFSGGDSGDATLKRPGVPSIALSVSSPPLKPSSSANKLLPWAGVLLLLLLAGESLAIGGVPWWKISWRLPLGVATDLRELVGRRKRKDELRLWLPEVRASCSES